jgi:hypothetical protein
MNPAGLDQPIRVPLVRVATTGAPTIVHAEFWDLGDWGQANLRIDGPADSNVTEPACAWRRDGAPLPDGTNTTTTGCTVIGLTRGSGFPASGGYNGRVLSVDITLPATYRCTSGPPTSCLFTATVTYTAPEPGQPDSTPADTTTFSASVRSG